jgi:hypothetical protein
MGVIDHLGRQGQDDDVRGWLRLGQAPDLIVEEVDQFPNPLLLVLDFSRVLLKLASA